MPRPRVATVPLKLLLLAVSLCFVLAAGEGALRVVGGPHFLAKQWGNLPYHVTDPVLGWRNQAGFDNGVVRINSLGYRGPELAASPERGTRILCLGDSGTFGVWVGGSPEALRTRFIGYPLLLRRMTAPRNVAEVVNGGVSGYSSSHGLRLFATEGVRLEPDIVIVRFGVNDHRRSGNPNRRALEPRNPLLRAMLYRLYDMQLVRLGLEAWTMADVHPKRRSVRWVSLEQYEKNIQRFGEIAREHDIDLLLLDTPLRPLERGESENAANIYTRAGYSSLAEFHLEHEFYQNALERVAEEEGIAFLETRELLQRHDRYFSDLDFVHPNSAGARAIAMSVVRELMRRQWISPKAAAPAAERRSNRGGSPAANEEPSPPAR